MQASEHHAVKVLNGLIETTLETAEGYKEAAEHTSNAAYKQMFAERAQRRRELMRKLQDEVRSFGAKPEEHESLAGKLHNRWAGMMEKMSGGSDKAVIDEVERGEDMIKARYRKAAEDNDLPQRVRQMLVACAAEVKAEHDEISKIKHSLH
ncbi:PA2169 family four-helix-bundle protein [Caulobacter sp. 17J65-9]|uniref:ferritin-like domain-containing protein n=1 Tax=Caulobacter sp. 17J65-9 TaxID=2709382 RepID=UPI0013C7C88D|nr:PA2169 family four-helix-bundle protein [Caulobacter sp. 17J65-9]NEX92631.1 PA2169 family four-helix-bundle protein [Caulobacter sp. 17J65-9]